MDPSFWHERWRSGRIGFHHDEPNPYLVEYLPALDLAPGARVLVPLCGKSVDLAWLAGQGVAPVGVELSPIAVAAVFEEAGIEAERDEPAPGLERWRGGGIEVWCGDFFALTPDVLGPCDALWDRAALIALPEAERPGYVAHCAALLAPGARGLLVTFWFDPDRMEGPPFPVAPPEVEALYARDFAVETLAGPTPAKLGAHLRERGLEAAEEGAWRLTRRPAGANNEQDSKEAR